MTAVSWMDALSAGERRELLEVSPIRGWISIVTNWALVLAAMALVAWVPHVLTVLLALFVIGARQLGMAVLMHEASHRTLLESRRLNDFAGRWLSSYAICADMDLYRPYHLQHHAHTGGPNDPDVGLVVPFPITRASLARKIWGDLSGQTGWKQMRAQLRGSSWRALGGYAVPNAVLLGVVTLAGHPELYLLWAVAWLTTYRLVTRIRSIAEHAMSPDMAHELLNTRTTLARWWERLLVAPNRVNYHLEHHLMMTVPHYNLPRMHRLLAERGVLERANVLTGYPAVLRLAASR